MVQQEFRAIKIGLIVALKMSCPKLLIMSYSSIVVNILLGYYGEPWYLRNLVRTIRELLSRLPGWRVKHNYRGANRAADWLARRNHGEMLGCIPYG